MSQLILVRLLVFLFFLFFSKFLSEIKLVHMMMMLKMREVQNQNETNIIIQKSHCLVIYFDFWVAAGASAAAGFFDFMTIATIRCSSIRKARTILNNKKTKSQEISKYKRKSRTEDGHIWHNVSLRMYVKLFSIVLLNPYVLLDVMLWSKIWKEKIWNRYERIWK